MHRYSLKEEGKILSYQKRILITTVTTNGNSGRIINYG